MDGPGVGRRVPLWQSPVLLGYFVPARSRRHDELVVTFHGFRNEPGFAPLGFGEMFLESRGFDAVHFLVPRNDWYIFDGAEAQIAAALDRLPRQGRRIAYGNSMGGYAALRYAAVTAVAACVAVAPQFSIDPALVPFERRWRWDGQATAGLAAGRMPAALRDVPVTIILDTAMSDDLAHAMLIHASVDRLRCIDVPGAAHDPLRTLLDAGLHEAVMLAALKGTELGETGGRAREIAFPPPGAAPQAHGMEGSMS